MIRRVRFGVRGPLAALLSLAIVVVLCFRALSAWRSEVARVRDDLSVAVRELNESYALVESTKAMRDSLRARRARLDALTRGLIAARSSADASSRLSAVVSRSARDVGLSLTSMALVVQDHSALEPSVTRVRAEARGDVAGLTQFLLLFEGGADRIRVVSLDVRPLDPLGAAQTEELALSFTIEGLVQVQNPPLK